MCWACVHVFHHTYWTCAMSHVLVTCHKCVMCHELVFSHVSHVSIMMWSCDPVGHMPIMSITCHKHQSRVNRVAMSVTSITSVMCWVSYMLVVSGIGHVSYMLITWRSRVDHVSVTSLSHANPVHRVSHVTQTCWSHANCQLCVSHVLVVNHAPCHVDSHVTQVFMWQSRVDCVNLMARVGDVSCSNHVSDMSQICQSHQSCAIMWQSWVTCQPCSSQVSHTCWSRDHVCHLLDTCNHMSITSVTCWTHANNINHVSCIHCFPIVSFVSQSCVKHISHVLIVNHVSHVTHITCWPQHSHYTRVDHSDHVSTMCQSCQSHVCHMSIRCQHHMLITWWSRISRTIVSIACQSLVTSMSVICHVSSVMLVTCQFPVTHWPCIMITCWDHVLIPSRVGRVLIL